VPALEERITALEASVSRLTEALTDTVATLRDLVGTLKPTAEVLQELAGLVKNLVEAQLRVEKRLEALEGRVDRLEAALTRLAEAQAETEKRLGELADRVDALARAQAETEKRLGELADRVDALARAQAETEKRLGELADRVGELDGFYQEVRFSRRAPAVLGRAGFRRVRPVPAEELFDLIDTLEEQGRLLPEERNRLAETDLVVRARRDGQEVWVAVEVSSTVDVRDARRAAESAALLARTLGVEAAAAVAGRRIGPKALREARRLNVLILVPTGR